MEAGKGMIEIRLMQKDDIPQIAQLEKETFSLPWNQKALEESFLKETYLFIAASFQKQVIGYIGMYIVLEEGNITNIIVSKKYRRNKIAARMLTDLFLEAKKRGVSRITLEVRKSNEGAIRLYENAGFNQTGVRRNYYEKPEEDAIIMWKEDI